MENTPFYSKLAKKVKYTRETIATRMYISEYLPVYPDMLQYLIPNKYAYVDVLICILK